MSIHKMGTLKPKNHISIKKSSADGQCINCAVTEMEIRHGLAIDKIRVRTVLCVYDVYYNMVYKWCIYGVHEEIRPVLVLTVAG